MTQVHKTKTVSIANLTPFPGNPNKHTDEQIALLCASIQEFGWTRTAIIDENNVILCGHGSIEAAKLAGLEKVSVSIVTGLSDVKKKALVIADNQLAKKSDVDLDDLAALVNEIIKSDFDVDILGFADSEMKRILDKMKSGDEKQDDDGYHDPIIQYQIVFDDENQQNQWYAFMKQVRTVAHGETFAESLSQWISDNVEFTD